MVLIASAHGGLQLTHKLGAVFCRLGFDLAYPVITHTHYM